MRISPYDNQGRRQTSFAGVDVVPVVEQTDHVDIPEDELRIDVYRSSGPGGQGVNTTDSAVRITHLPTGIVVSCQNERSQLQNRATAMTVLQAKLLERTRQEEKARMNELRGESTSSWGTQIRNYVLHPYQIVKDLRTGTEAGNPSAVLDGDIDEFVEAEIRWMRQQESGDGEYRRAWPSAGRTSARAAGSASGSGRRSGSATAPSGPGWWTSARAALQAVQRPSTTGPAHRAQIRCSQLIWLLSDVLIGGRRGRCGHVHPLVVLR